MTATVSCDSRARFLLTAITEIRRCRYIKFAKFGPSQRGPPKKISRLAIARHGGPPNPINLFVTPTLSCDTRMCVLSPFNGYMQFNSETDITE